jgi:hypothetical protein
MREYTPDTWSVLEITSNGKTIYKVFAGWYGGFGGGDSWQLNSGIAETLRHDNVLEFVGNSGSRYFCHFQSCKLSFYQQSVLENWKQSDATIKVLSIDEVLDKWYNNL